MGRAMPGAAQPSRIFRNRKAYRGQVLILAVVVILLFIFVATALVDVYHMEEGRTWGYRVAQDAALAGASGQVSGVSNWVVFQPTVDPTVPTPTPGGSTCIDPVLIKLDEATAYSAAEKMLKAEMTARGFHYTGDFISGDYLYEIKVIPDSGGGTIPNWPPRQVRLGAGRGEWSTTSPAVGVYISFRVSTFLMSIVGQSTIEVHVFAAAAVAEPAQCPP
jgi:hypothetical protein